MGASIIVTILASWLCICYGVGAQGVAQGTADIPTSKSGPLPYEVLSNFTRSIIIQTATSVAQEVLIPLSAFAERSCQIIYLASPDWVTSEISVDFEPFDNTQPTSSGVDANGYVSQFFRATVGGYDAPSQLPPALMKLRSAPWSLVYQLSRGALEWYKKQAAAAATADASAGSGSGGSGRRRRLSEFKIPLERVIFKSYWDYLLDFEGDGRADFLRFQYDDDLREAVLPGPNDDDDLRVPVMASPFYQTDPVLNEPGPTVDALEAAWRSGGTPNVGVAGVESGAIRIYGAPATECLSLLGSNRSRGGISEQDRLHRANVTSDAFTKSRVPYCGSGRGRGYDACFVNQHVLYVFNNNTAASMVGMGGGLDLDARCARLTNTSDPVDRLACLMDSSDYMRNATRYMPEGYVRVVVRYKPYDRCIDKGLDTLAQAAQQICFWSIIIFYVLIVALFMLPSVFRIVLQYPLYGILLLLRRLKRKVQRTDTLPLTPQLDTHKPAYWNVFTRTRWFGLDYVLGWFFWLRKWGIYAIVSIHSADGQYRLLQVAINTTVALVICNSAFLSGLDPILDHYVTPVALRITRSGDAQTKSLSFFIETMISSCYIGTAGFMASLANFGTPSYRAFAGLAPHVASARRKEQRRLYMAQCVISVFGTLLLNALVVVQISGIGTTWTSMARPYPYLVFAICQAINLIVVDVIQVMLCVRRVNRRDQMWERELAMIRHELREKAQEMAERDMRQEEEARRASPLASTLSAKVAAAHAAEGSDSRRNRRRMDSSNSVAVGASAVDLSEAGAGSSSLPTTPKARASLTWQEGEGDREGEARRRQHIKPHHAAKYAAADEEGGKEGQGTGPGHAGGDHDEHPASLRERLVAIARWPLAAYREDCAFRFPAWFMAALLTAGIMVLFNYVRALSWINDLEDCIIDPAHCIGGVAGRYLMMANQELSRDRQLELNALLQDTMGTRGGVEGLLGGVVNGSVDPIGLAIQAGNIPPTFLSDLQATALSLSNDTISQVAAAAINTSLLSAEQAAKLTASLTAQLEAAVAERLNLTAAMAAVARQTAAAVQNSTAFALYSNLDVLYTAIGSVSDMVKKTVVVRDTAKRWAEGIHARFQACGAVGFTLGLLLGLASLMQTAASFRIAARRARLEVLVERLFHSRQVEEGKQARQAAGAAAKQAGGKWAEGDSGEGGAAEGGAAQGQGQEQRGGWGGMQLPLDETQLLARRARAMPVATVVFFLGALLSAAVIQLYLVGTGITIGLVLATHPWTYTWLIPRIYWFIIAVVLVVVINKFVLVTYVGNHYLSDGNRMHHPAAWMAFLTIVSATNLVIGLFIAAVRLVILVFSSIVALGKFDVSLFTYFSQLDVPHNAFLAGLHLTEATSNFCDPIYLPGGRGRAHRRWRRLREVVRALTADELRAYAHAEGGKPDSARSSPGGGGSSGGSSLQGASSSWTGGPGSGRQPRGAVPPPPPQQRQGSALGGAAAAQSPRTHGSVQREQGGAGGPTYIEQSQAGVVSR